MIKRSTLLLITVGAIAALAAPAAAQADELAVSSGEATTPLKVGAEFTLTSTNLKVVSPIGTITCSKVTVHEELTQNGPTITAKEKFSQIEGCNHTVTGPKYGSLSMSGLAGKLSGTTFAVDGLCTYTGSIPFSYVTNSSTITVTGTTQLTGSPSFPCGKATVSGTFTLELSNKTPVVIL